MRLSLLTAGAALLLCQTAAMAQTTTPPANANNQQPAASSTNTNGGQLRAHVQNMLQTAGFSDIRMLPSSFMIRAKDQEGNPVVMSVSPDSFTEVSELGTSNGNGANGSVNGTNGSPNNGSQFVSVGQNDELSSNLVGLDVYNSQNQDIGQIKDIAMGPQGRTQALIVSVGGFLGMGEHYVAVNPSDVKVSYNNSDQKWHATTSATTAELKAAPQFQYNGRWNASKS